MRLCLCLCICQCLCLYLCLCRTCQAVHLQLTAVVGDREGACTEPSSVSIAALCREALMVCDPFPARLRTQTHTRRAV
jgi:hypothetical protein